MTGRDICVLLGGPSAEHDVSLVSGRAVGGSLAARGHRVEGWLIDLAGGWWLLPAPALDESLPAVAFDEPMQLAAHGPLSAGAAMDELASRRPRPIVWIALHGPFGEDGTVQALCEASGLTYTGSRVAASALGMDKGLFKRLTSGLGMPVVPWLEIGASEFERDGRAVMARLADFATASSGGRLIIKPARLGSSVGISVVQQPDEPPELEFALAQAFRFDRTAIVEAYLDHPRELEASVLGNDAATTEVFGPGEIFPGREFYDYTAKYQAGISRTTATPELPALVRGRIRALARQAFLAVGAEGFARIDFLLAADELYISEMNTIPGFTPISLFPLLCAEGGYDFGATAERIVELALEREAGRPDGRLSRADLP